MGCQMPRFYFSVAFLQLFIFTGMGQSHAAQNAARVNTSDNSEKSEPTNLKESSRVPDEKKGAAALSSGGTITSTNANVTISEIADDSAVEKVAPSASATQTTPDENAITPNSVEIRSDPAAQVAKGCTADKECEANLVCASGICVEATTTPSEQVKVWYVFIGGIEQGPYSDPEIENQIKTGRIRTYTAVSKNKDAKDWKLAGDIFTQSFDSLQSQKVKNNGDTSNPMDVDVGFKKYRFSAKARRVLKKIGIPFLAVGLSVSLVSIVCVARGEPQTGSEWVLDDGQCLTMNLAIGGTFTAIAIPLLAIAGAKKRGH
jgi:hypothetical protein